MTKSVSKYLLKISSMYIYIYICIILCMYMYSYNFLFLLFSVCKFIYFCNVVKKWSVEAVSNFSLLPQSKKRLGNVNDLHLII